MKLNVNKMRRNVIRQIPDVLELTVDMMDEHAFLETRRRIDQFTAQMEVKHNNQGEIVSYCSSNLDNFMHVTVEYRRQRTLTVPSMANMRPHDDGSTPPRVFWSR